MYYNTFSQLDGKMIMPIIEFPAYIEELAKNFYCLFKQQRQIQQFKRLLTGFSIADKHTIAHMNGLFVSHTNQSNLNRFITESDWDPIEMNRIKIDMINDIENGGVVVLDDYITEKYGKDIILGGNIDKRVFVQGKEAVHKEVMSKVPFLLETGPYFPSLDHAIPPDVPLESFHHYLNLLREIGGRDKLSE